MNRREALTAGLLAGAAAGLPAAGAQAAGPLKEQLVPAQRTWSDPPPQAPAKAGLVELSNTRLWVWDTGGGGQPVVLLHPATGSHAVWVYQQPVFAKAGFRVIGYSRRGHYQSDPHKEGVPAADLDDLVELLDKLGIAKTHMVGSAAGGFTTMDMVRKHPDRLLSVVVASSMSGGATRPGQPSLQPPGWEKLPADFREVSPSYRAMNPAGTALWNKLEEESSHGPRAARGGGPLPAGGPPMASGPLPAQIPPLLLLTGDADLYIPPPVMRAFAETIPGCEFAAFAEAGHATFWEQPDGFNRVVLDFLRRHSRPKRA